MRVFAYYKKNEGFLMTLLAVLYENVIAVISLSSSYIEVKRCHIDQHKYYFRAAKRPIK